MGEKDDAANGEGAEGGDEDGGGGDVFGFGDEGVKVGLGDIAEEFEGGVEGFGHPDGDDGEDDQDPFFAGDAEEGAGEDHGEGGEGVEPGVVLGGDHGEEAAEGVAEAADAAGELEGALHGEPFEDVFNHGSHG